MHTCVVCESYEVHTTVGIRFLPNLQIEVRIELDTSKTEFPRPKISWSSQLYSFIWTACSEFVNNLTNLIFPEAVKFYLLFKRFLFPFAKVKACFVPSFCFTVELQLVSVNGLMCELMVLFCCSVCLLSSMQQAKAKNGGGRKGKWFYPQSSQGQPKTNGEWNANGLSQRMDDLLVQESTIESLDSNNQRC